VGERGRFHQGEPEQTTSISVREEEEKSLNTVQVKRRRGGKKPTCININKYTTRAVTGENALLNFWKRKLGNNTFNKGRDGLIN